MRKEMIFALAALFFMTLSITGVYAGEEDNKWITISTSKQDVTGDKKEDTIIIKGLPYEEGETHSFLKEIQLQINASNGKVYTIALDGGYSPKIKFLDLNHDGIKDMFVSSDTGGSGGITNHYLYTLKDFNLTDLTVPDALVINGQFQNGYKASITIQETGESVTFDLRNRGKEYEKSGLYINGKLSEPTELMVDPFAVLKPKLVTDDKMYGLIGYQAISGAYHADRIAIVKSIWLYENGKWVLKDTKILESKS
ncbi:hypothetical protein J2Z40_000436 [Cytobacillus eiseniae]|uniref:Spore coat protein n=1 Tax=Cytobacillus eiseniae TaxID=762947 RepID=A0ABS4RAF4_9BACI|nr:hypothetical protein [Cytobacillus eiseniae]MBP2239883.1 hypothetical protein [Cytobacillus eiseniae]